MSSLAASRADNFYYPPEYRAEHGSLNKFQGSHPLGVRAKRISEGILVIRFEMPYKVWCEGCNTIVAQGVRFNADKKCIGQYFTTKIWEFTMTCYRCNHVFKIKTDPQNCEYVITAGLRKKIETYDADDAETLEFRTLEEREKLNSDPMLKLETQQEDKAKAETKQSRLEALQALQSSRFDSDYALNSQLRKRFRETRKEEKLIEMEMKRPKNFAIPLVPFADSDNCEASAIVFKSLTGERNRLKKAKSIISSSRSKSSTSLKSNRASLPASSSSSSLSSSTTHNHNNNIHSNNDNRQASQSSLPSSSSFSSQSPSSKVRCPSESSNKCSTRVQSSQARSILPPSAPSSAPLSFISKPQSSSSSRSINIGRGEMEERERLLGGERGLLSKRKKPLPSNWREEIKSRLMSERREMSILN